MPRNARAAKGGIIYHCLNRGNGRQRLFHKPADFDAFLALLAEAKERADIDLLGYCLMPDHWHLVLRPAGKDDLRRFMAWVGVTHVRRYHAQHPARGGGHLYQSRYKSFPIQEDRPLLTVLRYVEANPVRAKEVKRAEKWEWSSLAARPQGNPPVKLAAWPVRRPADWAAMVNEPMDRETLAMVRKCIARGRPFGDPAWVARAAVKLGLESTLRPIGRPRKTPEKVKGK